MLLSDKHRIDDIEHVQSYADQAENLNYEQWDVGKVNRDENRLEWEEKLNLDEIEGFWEAWKWIKVSIMNNLKINSCFNFSTHSTATARSIDQRHRRHSAVASPLAESQVQILCHTATHKASSSWIVRWYRRAPHSPRPLRSPFPPAIGCRWRTQRAQTPASSRERSSTIDRTLQQIADRCQQANFSFWS